MTVRGDARPGDVSVVCDHCGKELTHVSITVVDRLSGRLNGEYHLCDWWCVYVHAENMVPDPEDSDAGENR